MGTVSPLPQCPIFPFGEFMPGFLTIDNVSKQFGGLRAVDSVSFEVGEGSLSAIIGPNGAGKTTVFNLIAGALGPTSGQVAAWRMGIGRTFQNVRLFREMSVLENVLVGMAKGAWLEASLRMPKSVDADRLRMKKAYYILEDVGLEKLADARAGEIAFGQQRLLEIARSMAFEPRILLLDEPAAGLNRTETTALAGLIRRIRDRGTTVLLVEHDMHLVMNLAEWVYVLDGGKKIAEGTPSEVSSDRRVCEAYLGASGEADRC